MQNTVSADRIDRVCREAEKWREQLVDTSGRNRLRTYRKLQTGTLDLTPDADSGPDALALDRLLAGRTVSLTALFPALPDDTDAFDDARRRLSAIRRNARSDLEEKGIDTLFAAIGLATWEVEPGVTPPKAPVLLAPLDIKPVGKKGFNISIAGDIILNPVLTYILDRDHGVDARPISQQITDAQVTGKPLGAFASYKKLREWLTYIESSWSGWMEQSITGWHIEPRMVVGTFRYASQAMVEDLKEHCEHFAKNDLVAAIAGDPSAQGALKAAICDPDPAYDQPDRKPPADEFLVLDADSSQHRAINRVLGGESLVIQGPPGTGKSQTIANLIAMLMARRQRVLFVAEKRAAIEAVTKRLREVDLADLVMDFHGGIQGKQQFAQALRNSLEMVGTNPIADHSSQPNLVLRRNSLVEHRAALHKKRDPWGLSVFEIQERLLAVPDGAQTKLLLPEDVAKGISSKAFKRLAHQVEEWVDLDGHALDTKHPEWSRSAVTTQNQASKSFNLARELDWTYFPEARDAHFATLDELALARTETVVEWRRALDFLVNVQTDARALARRCVPSGPYLAGGGAGSGTRIALATAERPTVLEGLPGRAKGGAGHAARIRQPSRH